jgi:hypothetical protein
MGIVPGKQKLKKIKNIFFLKIIKKGSRKKTPMDYLKKRIPKEEFFQHEEIKHGIFAESEKKEPPKKSKEGTTLTGKTHKYLSELDSKNHLKKEADLSLFDASKLNKKFGKKSSTTYVTTTHLS